MTLDLYGHLYDDDLDVLADGLDCRLAESPAPPVRPAGSRAGRADAVCPVANPYVARVLGRREWDSNPRNP